MEHPGNIPDCITYLPLEGREILIFPIILETIDLNTKPRQSSARFPSFALDRQRPRRIIMPRSSPPVRTQFFSNTLLLLMERNGLNQVKLSAATSIAVSRINNYLKGRYRTIRPDHLGLIAKAVGRTQEECGELTKAYLLDLLPELLYPVVRIEVSGARSQGAKAEPIGTGLPPAAATALSKLHALGIRSAKARARLLWFAELMQEAHGS